MIFIEESVRINKLVNEHESHLNVWHLNVHACVQLLSAVANVVF